MSTPLARLFWTGLLVLAATCPALAAGADEPVTLARFAEPPVVDGLIDDVAWSAATRFAGFVETYPGDNTVPAQKTEVLMGYDAKALYVAFHAYDNPAEVRANLSMRDEIWDDDRVGLYLDTFGDRRRAYVLFFNPLGIQADAVRTEGRGEDYSVDLLMTSKGRLTDDGYVVEVAIPFTSLRYDAGASWGLHLQRVVERQNGVRQSWKPLRRDGASFLAQAGQIAGLEGIGGERTVEVIPTFALVQTGRRVSAPAGSPEPMRFLTPPAEGMAGLSLKVGITPNVTLDCAFNPDFAQVEADAPVLTANQRYPIFYTEKRPFFLEGIDIFQTSLRAVHTRAIVDPDAAGKLTGKVGKTSFGVLVASDAAPGNYSEEERDDPYLLPLIAKYLDKNALDVIARVKRDVGKQSSLGLIATSYDFVDRYNRVLGIDGTLRPTETSSLSFAIAGSTSKRRFYDPESDASEERVGNGLSFNWSYGERKRLFGYSAGGDGRTSDYRSDLGFVFLTGSYSNRASLWYRSEPKKEGTLLSWGLSGSSFIRYDAEGRAHGSSMDANLNLQFARQTFVGVGLGRAYDRLFEDEFGPRRGPGRPGAFLGDAERSTRATVLFANVDTSPTTWLSAHGYFSLENGVWDYDYGAGPRFPRVSPAALLDPTAPLDPGPARSVGYGAGVSFRPSEALSMGLNHSASKLTRRDTGLLVYSAQFFSASARYQFTRTTGLRAVMHYETLGRGASGQFLFSWTPSPGTALYAGYNDSLTYRPLDWLTGLEGNGLVRQSRTVFVKASYLFRFAL